MIERQPLRTKRLVLEPIGPEHLPGMWEATQASLEQLRPWLPWAQHASEAASREFAESAAEHWAAGTDYAFAMMLEGSYIGGVGLHRSHLEALSSVGYWVRTDRAGKGYTTEATGGLLAFAFDVARMYRVELRAGVENRPSQRVAEKLGFTREGVLRRGCPVGADRAYDCFLYGLLAEDWHRRA